MATKHRKLKLSDKRKKWVSSRDTSIKGDPVKVNETMVRRQAMEVSNLVEKMHRDVSGQINRLFAKPVAKSSIKKTERVSELDEAGMVESSAMDASISAEASALTSKLARKWTKRFNSFGDDWTRRMIGKSEKQSAKDLRRSMSKMSGGLTIDTNQLSEKTKDKLIASADQSSSLIKSIGAQYTTAVKEAVSRSVLNSSSSFSELQDSIQSMLNDKYRTHKNKAFNTAKDQTRKVYSNLTASRMQDIGAGTYIWRHSGGSQRPRCYHRDVLNGQTFSLDNPPIIDEKTGQRGKPGDLISCKCYMQPIISFENKGANTEK